LWLPSQSGGFFVCLHWHHQTVDFSATSNFTGCNPVPLWDPSQKGGWLDLPQEHQKWVPASTSMRSGLLSQTIGFSDMGECRLLLVLVKTKKRGYYCAADSAGI